MKKLFTFLLIITTLSFISCSKDDDTKPSISIIGKWKLLKASFYNPVTKTDNEFNIDYNPYLTLDYKSGNQVEISGYNTNNKFVTNTYSYSENGSNNYEIKISESKILSAYLDNSTKELKITYLYSTLNPSASEDYNCTNSYKK
ncbi:hypothetical protein KO02_12215 [Sphingobacterium sp. ML3W]|uniref:hypothetical protein n=1 Tax=Sphingobacterium sp. ML3W TaxID=1538644 RepID=UPI0004F7C6A0|nr:hypothetical protein [Sphingobacterium sp. ML3W]AIM37370.1 hypothetical protein KO02_12215 [Sphingobacterium sp. ML3W]